MICCSFNDACKDCLVWVTDKFCSPNIFFLKPTRKQTESSYRFLRLCLLLSRLHRLLRTGRIFVLNVLKDVSHNSAGQRDVYMLSYVCLDGLMDGYHKTRLKNVSMDTFKFTTIAMQVVTTNQRYHSLALMEACLGFAGDGRALWEKHEYPEKTCPPWWQQTISLIDAGGRTRAAVAKGQSYNLALG